MSIENTRPLSLVEEIRTVLTARIRSGELKRGDQLPPLSVLTRELGAGLSTTRQALELMTRDGWITKRQGKGTFVSGPMEDNTPSRRPMADLNIVLLVESTWVKDRESTEFVQGFELGLATHHGLCRLLLYPGSDPAARQQCMEQLADADVICSCGIIHNFDDLLRQAYLRNRTIISVGFGCTFPVHCIRNDWKWGMYTMLEYLQSLGHHRIALASLDVTDVSPELVAWVAEREQAFTQFTQTGANIFRIQVPFPALEDFDSIRAAGRRIADDLLQAPTAFTAVVGLNDAVAVGVVERLRAAGRRIPEDISVAGIDNNSTALNFCSLTTIEHHSRKMGLLAADMITELNSPVGQDKLRIEAVRPQLIKRFSTMPPHDTEITVPTAVATRKET